MSLFLKLFDETQIPTTPEATRRHDLKKLLIPLPLRADLLLSVHSETPCIALKTNSLHYIDTFKSYPK